MVKRVGKYEIGRTLGEGTFGKVKYAVHSATGQRVAIKILDKEKIQKQNMGAQIKKEISIMKMVKHDHVVKLYEVLASRRKIFIVLELITGGELFDKIVAEGHFKEETARFYFRQLVRGVTYCHRQGVCHRDLKPENLLLDEHDNLKISDFGLSALYTSAVEDESRSTLLHTTCGTPNYVAPEVLNDKGYDGRAADVWSMGVILYVLLAGFLPFDEPHMSALFRKIQKAEFVYPVWFSTEVRALLDKILVAGPTERVSLADIEKDPWYLGTDGGGEPVGASAASEAKTSEHTMPHVPSARDLSEAISDGVEVEGDSKLDVPELNVFETVNMFGGMILSRMLSSSSPTVAARKPQLLSAKEPAELLAGLRAAAPAAGLTVVADDEPHVIKGSLASTKGEITVRMGVYSVSESLRMITITRGKGDVLEFNKIFNTLAPHIAPLALPAKPT